MNLSPFTSRIAIGKEWTPIRCFPSPPRKTEHWRTPKCRFLVGALLNITANVRTVLHGLVIYALGIDDASNLLDDD